MSDKHLTPFHFYFISFSFFIFILAALGFELIISILNIQLECHFLDEMLRFSSPHIPYKTLLYLLNIEFSPFPV
jgi:hypothetical protein